MSWQDDHQKRVSRFPDNVRTAHQHSSWHRGEILGSSNCGCFHCTALFSPASIKDWVDEDGAGVGQTALCPECGVDSVIGDKSGIEVSKKFLAEMKKHWF